MLATPRLDALLSPSRQTGNVVPLTLEYGKGGRIMSDTPTLHPNAAGLELMAEIAVSLRGVEEHVGNLREGVASLNGADLPGRVRALEARLLTLETERAGEAGTAKPFKFAAGKVAETLITAATSAAVAVGGTLLALGGKDMTP